MLHFLKFKTASVYNMWKLLSFVCDLMCTELDGNLKAAGADQQIFAQGPQTGY